MEHTLGALCKQGQNAWESGLNPCFNGTYSRRWWRSTLRLERHVS